MSATFKSWEKAAIGSIGAILLTWSGWALSNTFVRSQCNQRINEISARVDTVQGEQERRRSHVESIPVIVEKVTAIEQQSKENGRELREIRAAVARIEGRLEKTVAKAGQ